MNRKLILIPLCSFIFLFSGCSGSFFLSTSQRLEKQADQLVLDDRLNEAILAYHQAISADPTNRAAIKKLAPLYFYQGRTREAAKLMRLLSDHEKAELSSIIEAKEPDELEDINFEWIVSPDTSPPVGIAASNTVVVVCYRDGLISAHNLEDGSPLWQWNSNRPITSPPAISSNQIFIGDQTGILSAVNESNGKLVWESELPGTLYAQLLTDKSTGYIGTYNGIMTAINLADGKILWQMDAGSPIVASAMVDRETLYFGTTSGLLYALRTQDGKPVWERPVQLPGGIESTPVLSNNRLFITNNDSRLYALDMNGKDYYWTFSTPDSIYADALIVKNQAVIFSIGQTAAAVNVDTGEHVWKQETPVAVARTPIIINSTIYFAGTTSPYLYSQDSDTGEISGQANTGDWIEYGPIKSGDYLLLGGKDGAILVYRIFRF